MSLPVFRVNNFMQENRNPNLDIWSKIFIVTEWALGLNRVALLGRLRPVYCVLLFICGVIINIVTIGLFITNERPTLFSTIMYFKLFQYVLCVILSFIFWKKLQFYYSQLDKLDSEVAYKPKFIWAPMKMISCLTIFSILAVAVFATNLKCNDAIEGIIFYLTPSLEYHYYAHLINLLTFRLRFINSRLVESAMSKDFDIMNKTDQYVGIKINKLFVIYRTLMNAHDLLIDAIKWQVLVILSTSFIFFLGFSYKVTLDTINTDSYHLLPMPRIGLIAAEFVPLFFPCICSDQLRSEVRRLRELLASKIYTEGLDKCDRRLVRTLLSLMETRDLRFSLLRTVEMAIALPFKFLGLLVTYLIILLQFQKL